MAQDFSQDIEAVARIDAVPTILDVVCRITGMGFAAVARVTEDRWIACSVRDDIGFGLEPGGELQVETTICNEIRQSGEAVVIDHVAEDTVYCGHPTPAMYGFQSYISMPIRLHDGRFFGTLCSIDPRPARVNTPQIIGMFKLLADLIAFHLDASDRISRSEADLARSEASLIGEREDSQLREQFIAVLGHDLRNPLGAIDAGVQLLSKSATDERSTTILTMMRASVARMTGLVTNVLDFARGRLGGGLTLELKPQMDVAPLIHQVVDELRAVNPGRRIDVRTAVSDRFTVDPARIGQLLSNLVANALTHGATDQPIVVEARTHDGAFELSVANGGDEIEPAVMQHLFRPFFRGDVRSSQQGLGLGLFIASEIARAHGGEMSATSTAQETRFTFRMPLG